MTRIAAIGHVPGCEREVLLCEVEAKTDRDTTNWLLPMSIAWEDEPMLALPSQLALARVRRARRMGFLTDAFSLPGFAHGILAALAAGTTAEFADGVVRFDATELGRSVFNLKPDAEVNWLSAEQSNSSLIVGDAVVLKLFRRMSAGEHPEAEMGRYLTAAGFAHAPPLLGEVVRVSADGTPFALAVAQGFVRNQGDAWAWMLDQLTRAIDTLGTQGFSDSSQADLFSDCESVATTIGRRLGEMHMVLARPTSETAFAPQIASASQAVDWGRTAQERLEAALDMIATRVGWERPEDQERAAELLHLRKELVAAVRKLAQSAEGSAMTRIHGDFHLGQVLVASGDAYIIDFEGEPARALAERRAKASPLRDVAGLLRSIDYAGATLIERKEVGAMPVAEAERNELIVAFRTRASRAFLRGYCEAAGSEIKQEHKLLELFLIDKAAYEIAYEANNRPTWIGVPLAGLRRLAGRVLDHRPVQ